MNSGKREMRVGAGSRRGRPPCHAGRGFAGALLVLMIPAVVAMSAGADAHAAVRSLLETRQDRVVIQKWDLSCGAAALATVLKYQYGEAVTEHEVALELMRRKEYLADPSLVRARQGFSLLDLQRAVDRFHRYKGTGLGRLTLEDLIKSAPVIVPVDFHGYNHFVVFRGVYRGRVLLADPAWGNRIMPVAAFAQVWREYPETGRIGFLVAPRDGKARPNRLAPRPEDFVTAPADFDDEDDRSVVFRRTSRGPSPLTGAALDTPVGSYGSGQAFATAPATGNQTLQAAISAGGTLDNTASLAEPSSSVAAPVSSITSPASAPVSSITAPAVSAGNTAPSPTSTTILPATGTSPTSATTSSPTTSLPILSTTTNRLAPLPQGLH